MLTVLPRQIHFLLADSVREELGGKLTVIGLYTGGEVILQGAMPADVPKGYERMALPGLTILAVCEDGEGQFQLEFELYDPSDRPLGKSAPTQVVKAKNAPQNLIFPLVPFLVPRFGRYRFELRLNNRKYEYSFTVRHSDPHASAPSPQIPSKTKARTSPSRKRAVKVK
jgi:hypothetical protein